MFQSTPISPQTLAERREAQWQEKYSELVAKENVPVSEIAEEHARFFRTMEVMDAPDRRSDGSLLVPEGLTEFCAKHHEEYAPGGSCSHCQIEAAAMQAAIEARRSYHP